MDEATRNTYTFQMTGPDGGIISVSFSVPYDIAWPEVVGRFADFMSAAYGYRIDALDALRG